jgi:hypothetical protein
MSKSNIYREGLKGLLSIYRRRNGATWYKFSQMYLVSEYPFYAGLSHLGVYMPFPKYSNHRTETKAKTSDSRLKGNNIKTSKSFIHQQMHYLLILENSKIYIKMHIKIAPTCFGPRPPSGSLHWSLIKVTLMLK